MILQELLVELEHDGYMVKVGAKKGAGFFYCDKITNKTYKEIEKISARYLSNLKAELKVKKELWANFDKYWKERLKNILKIKDEKYWQKILDETPKDKQEEKRKHLELKLKDLPRILAQNKRDKERMRINVPKRSAQLEKEIPQFTPILQRNVVEVYKGISPDEPKTKIIIIKGKENGDFSSIIEYQDRDLPEVLKRRIGWQSQQH